MTEEIKHIAITGGGLVGALLALYLRKRGYTITVFERRPDPRSANVYAGRSINLALSSRGIETLEEVGLADTLRQIAIPMHGRMMHDKKGTLTYQAYGKEGQYINSVSRGDLNTILINAAEKAGAEFLFEHRITSVNLEQTELTLTSPHVTPGQTQTKKFDLIIGADGAFSAVRGALQFTDRFNFTQYYIEHGYKELHIPAGVAGEFLLEKNALHIWPRESFMMIALPNPDGSFTCTLFFPFEGNPSFTQVNTEEKVLALFKDTFPDALVLMPELVTDFFQNPASSLVTIKCFPWIKHKTLLIGDAAHGIVPFYGQGMNAGFEDCRILNDLLNACNDNWEAVLAEFQRIRKPDADAIAQLALDNFVEMRDLVADAEFLLRKKIEAKIHSLYPEKWIPLYTMVTFRPDIRYSEAYGTGQKQRTIMDEVMKQPGIENNWQQLDFNRIVSKLEQLQKDDLSLEIVR